MYESELLYLYMIRQRRSWEHSELLATEHALFTCVVRCQGVYYYVCGMHIQVFVDFALSKFSPSFINVFYYSFTSLKDAFFRLNNLCTVL